MLTVARRTFSRRRDATRLCLTLGIMTAASAAQTFVVDSTGAGQYLDLPAAIAAVPDGAVLLVRPGSYSHFVVTNKSLTILGDDRRSVFVEKGNVSRHPQIGPTKASNRVLLARMTIRGFEPRIWSAKGPVLLDDITIESRFLFPSPMRISGSSNVQLHRVFVPPRNATGTSPEAAVTIFASTCTIERCWFQGPPSRASVGLIHKGGSGLYVDFSTVYAWDSAFVGGTPLQSVLAPGHGGYGVSVQNSLFSMNAGGCVGGQGGTAIHSPGGNGGDALRLERGADVRIRGVRLLPGRARQSGGLPGKNVTSFGAVSLTIESGAPNLSAVVGEAKSTAPLEFRHRAAAGAWSLLFLGTQQRFARLPSVGGILALDPLVVLAPLRVPASGVLTQKLRVPARIARFVPILAQHITIDAQQRWLLSNPMVVIFRS